MSANTSQPDRLGPRRTAFNALTRDLRVAERFADKLDRAQPRDPLVAELVTTVEQTIRDVTVLRTLTTIGQPIKRRPPNVPRKTTRGKRDWATLKRRQRAR